MSQQDIAPTAQERQLRELRDRNQRLLLQNIELQDRCRELKSALDEIFKIAVRKG